MVSLLQLLDVRSPGGEVHFETEEKESAEESFRVHESSRRSAPLWGNLALITVATGLREFGYTSNTVRLLDQSLGPVEGLGQVEEEFLGILNEGGAEDAAKYFADNFFGYIIYSIGLRRRRPESLVVQVIQNGALAFDRRPSEAALNQIYTVAKSVR